MVKVPVVSKLPSEAVYVITSVPLKLRVGTYFTETLSSPIETVPVPDVTALKVKGFLSISFSITSVKVNEESSKTVRISSTARGASLTRIVKVPVSVSVPSETV